jgi:hypothetical protein
MDVLNINTYRRRYPYHGPIKSDDFSELVEELVLDLTSIASNLNSDVQPLIESLPSGSRTIQDTDRSSEIDPIANGLDGSQLFLDMTCNDTDNLLLYNELEGRPNTIKEAFEYILFRIEQLAQSI